MERQPSQDLIELFTFLGVVGLGLALGGLMIILIAIRVVQLL